MTATATSPPTPTVTERACRSCGKPVYDLNHERTGKPAPIEVELNPEGNVIADLVKGTYRIVVRPDLERVRSNPVFLGLLRANHFWLCPDAGRWHKP